MPVSKPWILVVRTVGRTTVLEAFEDQADALTRLDAVCSDHRTTVAQILFKWAVPRGRASRVVFHYTA